MYKKEGTLEEKKIDQLTSISSASRIQLSKGLNLKSNSQILFKLPVRKDTSPNLNSNKKSMESPQVAKKPNYEN